MFWFVILMFLPTWIMAIDYCSICSSHTMCKYKGSGQNCGSFKTSGVSKVEIEEILKVHNGFRSRVASGWERRGFRGPQPKAANMQKLIWDKNLAEVAQKWADQCTFKHDICRDDPRFPVGQNIYFSSGYSTVNWTRAITAWYEEVSKFDPRNIDYFKFQPATGHYTQLVWANTRYIGCGRVSYRSLQRSANDEQSEYILSSNSKNESIASDNHPASNSDIMDHSLEQFKVKRELKLTTESSLKSSRLLQVSDMNQFLHSNSSEDNLKYEEQNPFSNNNYNSYKGKRQTRIEKNSNSRLVFDWITENWNHFFNKIKMKNHILVCNYGPSGNFLYQRVYIRGPTCSKCHPRSQCINGLCTDKKKQY